MKPRSEPTSQDAGNALSGRARSGRSWFSAAVFDECSQIWRDKSLLVMLLCLPLLYALTVGYLYGRESVVDAPVIVVDQDGSQKANRLAWLMDATQEVHVVERLGSVEQAFAVMRRHEACAVVLIPEQFEQRLLSKQPAKLKLWIDSANMLTYGTTYTGIRAATAELGNEITRQAFVNKGSGRRQAEQRTNPIELNEHLLFHPTGSYGGFMAPAVFIMALQQGVLLAFSVSVGSRRERRGRSDISEPHAYLALAARYLVHLPFHLLSAAMIATLTTYWYRFPASDAVRTFLLLAGFAVAVGPVAVLVSLCFTNGRTPLQILMLVSTPLFLASGYTWPLAQMPDSLQTLIRLVPSTPALAGLRTVVMSSGSLAALGDALGQLGRLFIGYAMAGSVIVAVGRWWVRRQERCNLAGSV